MQVNIPAVKVYAVEDEDNGGERKVSYCYLCDSETPPGCAVCDKCGYLSRTQYARDLRAAARKGYPE